RPVRSIDDCGVMAIDDYHLQKRARKGWAGRFSLFLKIYAARTAETWRGLFFRRGHINKTPCPGQRKDRGFQAIGRNVLET
ncbi:MAG TPA: hypothetical protein VE842_09050, partial [Pyrinomonadaceae bacterium]|nr:hypothetical protein [Pyrinomonadaceae bacterium]